MTGRRLVVRLVCAALVIVAAAPALVFSAGEVLRTGRPASAGGPIVVMAAGSIIVAALLAMLWVRAYLDATRPPQDAIVCASCGSYAARFDRRCRQCGARQTPD